MGEEPPITSGEAEDFSIEEIASFLDILFVIFSRLRGTLAHIAPSPRLRLWWCWLNETVRKFDLKLPTEQIRNQVRHSTFILRAGSRMVASSMFESGISSLCPWEKSLGDNFSSDFTRFDGPT